MSDTGVDEKKAADPPRVRDDSSSYAEGHVGDVEGGPSVRELHRNFSARHIQMICLGGCIGSGLFISTGKAYVPLDSVLLGPVLLGSVPLGSVLRVSLHYGGAPGMIIGYSLICSMALAAMNVLTENTCLFPTPGSFIDHASRFVDPALGFAIGFCEWLAWATVMAAEAAVVRVILTYWTEAIPTAACMTVYLVLVFGIHTLPNRWFGEFEFVTAALKVVAMVVILLTCIAILGGAGRSTTPVAVNYRELPVFPNGFKGVCQTFALAAWATGGQELMGLTAGEAKRPRWDMPRACVNLFVRILVFFELSVIFIGLLVPYTDARLLTSSTVASSPFVIAMNDAGISVLPDILNAVILLGLVAIGAESVYISSRAMVSMAKMGMLPRFLGHVDRQGRPYWSLVVTALFCIVFTYINCSNTGGIIFTWFSSIASTVYFMAWMVIALSNWQMHRAIQLQHDPAWKQPYAYRAPAYPSVSVYLFVTSFFVLFCTGYVSLYPIGADPTAYAFLESYLGVPIFIVMYLGYKVVRRTKFVNPAHADLTTGRRPLTEDDVKFLNDYYAQPIWKRMLSYVVF